MIPSPPHTHTHTHAHAHAHTHTHTHTQNGQFDRLQSLLNDPKAAVDARCPLTGDTPLIAAARNGHERAVELLVRLGADMTLQNDMEENALEVASKKIRRNILSESQRKYLEATIAQG